MSNQHKSIGICYDSAQLKHRTESLSVQLGVPLTSEMPQPPDFVLHYTESGLMLQDMSHNKQKPTYIDFTSGKAQYRRLHGGGKNQAIAKAIGIKAGYRPSIIDATAGLAQDSFVLASLGCNVVMIERSPIIAALIQDALDRANLDPDTAEITKRMKLYSTEAVQCIPTLTTADVIYLDPMFPDSNKTALAKKDMQILQALLVETNEDDLLGTALKHAKHRVVVKRPKNGPFLNNTKPSFQMAGSSNRFDIYLIK